MYLYRADCLKYDFIPMNKRIRRVYGQNLNDTVCVVDPVMRGLGVDLDAVARIQAVFAAVQIYGQDTLQNVDKFFTVVLIHLKLVFRACGGRRHQVEDTRRQANPCAFPLTRYCTIWGLIWEQCMAKLRLTGDFS